MLKESVGGMGINTSVERIVFAPDSHNLMLM